MHALKAMLSKLGRFLLFLFKSLRKIICCRRRRDQEYLLPMTVNNLIKVEQNMSPYELSQWDAWPETNMIPAATIGSGPEFIPQAAPLENENEDFFKDMVPQIRKTKKMYVRNSNQENREYTSSNRLAMDPNAILVEPDLGVIDDNPSTNWDDIESDELWDPDAIIREKKKSEQEKRRVENQRRKQEKENRRTSKAESLSSMMMNLADSNDKHKLRKMEC